MHFKVKFATTIKETVEYSPFESPFSTGCHTPQKSKLPVSKLGFHEVLTQKLVSILKVRSNSKAI